MHIKENKIEVEGTIPEFPNHIAFILAGFGDVAVPYEYASSSNSAFFPKNIIETAAKVGVQFLTICCVGGKSTVDKSSLSINLKVLYQRLTADQDWLQRNEIAVRFVDEGWGSNKLDNTKLNVSVISEFDGRDIILSAVRNISEKVEQEKITSNDITSSMIGEQIAPLGLPDPDLLIFTGGLKRLENGLIWQSAYSEFAFVDEHWENLTGEHFQHVLENYMARDRRFGGLSKQVHAKAKAV